MSTSIETRFSPKRVSFFLVAASIFSIVGTLLSGNSWLALVSIFLTGALPFALLAIWLPRSRLGKFVQAASSVWQLRIFGVSLLFAYSVYAHKWAGDVINDLFRVDSGHFGASTTVFSILFAPFGLIYRQDVIGWLWTAYILLAILITWVLPLSLLTPGRPALGWKAWVGGFVFFLAGAFILAMSTHLANSFKPLAMQFAIWADFNDSHLCTDDWSSELNSVVFLGDQRVLVYFPKKQVGSRFSVETCNLEKVF